MSEVAERMAAADCAKPREFPGVAEAGVVYDAAWGYGNQPCCEGAKPVIEPGGRLVLHFPGDIPEHATQVSRLCEALTGARGEDQKRIATVGLQWLDTLLRKNADYGSSAWKRPKLAPHLSVGDAILARMSDKVERIESLNGKQGEVNESLADTVSDLGSYALLWLARPE